MKFKFYLEDGKEVIFDNQTLALDDDSISYKIRKHKMEYYTPQPVDKSKPFLRRVKFVMGFSCNFKCKYCHQAPFMMPRTKDEDIELAKQTVRNILDKYDVGFCFEIWGGEPLLYWEMYKAVVEEIRKHPCGANLQISTISNGSLVTKEKMEFILKNKIHFLMSHDAQGQHLRNKKDPLDKPEVIEGLKWFWENDGHFSFHMVTTPENCNIIEACNWLRSKTFEDVDITIEGLVNKFSYNKEYTTFSEENIATMIATYSEAMKDDGKYICVPFKIDAITRMMCGGKCDDNDKGNVKYKLEKFMYPLTLFKDSVTKCACEDPSETVLPIYYNGDVLYCHGEPCKLRDLGNVNTDEEIDLSKKLKYHTPYGLSQKCQECIALNVCRGGCSRALGEEHDYYCQNGFIRGLVYICASIYHIYGKHLSKIERIE